jgi:hypothetical protein
MPVLPGRQRLLYLHWVYEYAKPNKIMNEIEKHLKKFASGSGFMFTFTMQGSETDPAHCHDF